MRLLNILAATVAASPLDCDVGTLFTSTCGINGFVLTAEPNPTEACSALLNEKGMFVTVVAVGGEAPGYNQTCLDSSLSGSYTFDVLSGTDNSDNSCWSSSQDGENLLMAAEVYITDSDNNRPFSYVDVSCSIPMALTVDDLTFSVTETSVTGPEGTGSVDTLAVKAWFDDAEDTTEAKVYNVGSHVWFYVEPPSNIHSALKLTDGSCTAGSQAIEESWFYGLADADCSVDGNTFTQWHVEHGIFGACMHIFASEDTSTTISCSANLGIM